VLFASSIPAIVLGLSLSLPVNTLLNTFATVNMAVLFYIIWAQRLDKRSLTRYGIDLSGRDIGQFVVGFFVTIVGTSLWFLFWIVTGRMSVDIVLSYSGGSFVAGVLLVSVMIVAGATTQELVFLGLIFNNSMEGIQSRVGDRTVAALSGISVTTVFFAAYHFLLNTGAAGFLPPLQAALFFLIGFGYFAAVYTYTGSLTAGIGAHAGSSYSTFLYGWERIVNTASISLPKIMTVTGSTPLTEVLGPRPFIGLVVSFALLVALTRTPVVTTNSDIVSDQS
jgi:membrane protease YdiL (CAAX protease family)